MPLPISSSRWLLAAVLCLGGCRNAASDKLAQRALRPEARADRQTADKVRGAVFNNSAITGWDAQHRPAWKLSARESRVGAGQDPTSPTRATLLGARAEIFRDGVLQSSFESARIEFLTVSTPAPGGKTRTSQRIVLSGGVRAQTKPPASKKGSPESKVVSAAPVTLEAPGATVSLSDKTVWVPASAVVVQKASGVRVQAKTLRADSSLKRVDMSQAVATSPRGRVRADRAIYNWDASRLLATGNVRAQAPASLSGGAKTNILLTGARLDADVAGGGGLLSGGVRAQGQEGQSGAATASQVRFNWRQKNLRALGGVTLQKDGATMSAAEIVTDADFAQATASGNVKLVKDGATVTAGSVRAFDKFTRAVASGGVRLSTSTSSGPTTVRAARVEAFDGFTRAVASGDVVLVQGASTIRAASVQAFDLKGAGRAVARGGVELVQDDVTVNASSVEAKNLRDRNALVVAASGGVRARGKDGRVSSRSVRWAGRRIQASGDVTLQAQRATLRGDTLTSDDKFENAVLTGHVGGTLPEGGTVSAGRIEKSGEKIVATGGVTARQQGVTLKMARLETTTSTAQVLGSGGVVLTMRDGATLRAPNVRYNKARDEAYAENGARYINKKEGLDVTGDSIVVRHVSDDKRRTATINGARGSGKSEALSDFKL